MPNKPTIVKGESIFALEKYGVSSDFSGHGLTKGDLEILFDTAHKAFEDVLQVVPADFTAEFPSEIQLYCGTRQYTAASLELGEINYLPVHKTGCTYDMTIPDVIGIAVHDLKHEQLQEPFLGTIRSNIRHELLHIITHRGMNVNLASVMESVIARLEQVCFGKKVLYDEDGKQWEDFGHRVRCTTGFRSPDGLQTRFDDETGNLIYDAGRHALDDIKADELWEILRKLSVVADERGLYPRYLDILAALRQVLGDGRTSALERTPTFAEMHTGIHGMVSENDAGALRLTAFRSEELDDTYLVPPFHPLPSRFAVSKLPSVNFVWQIFEPSNKLYPRDGHMIKELQPLLTVEPKKFTQAALRRFGQEKHVEIDRLTLSFYEKPSSKDLFFTHTVDNPLADKPDLTP